MSRPLVGYPHPTAVLATQKKRRSKEKKPNHKAQDGEWEFNKGTSVPLPIDG